MYLVALSDEQVRDFFESPIALPPSGYQNEFRHLKTMTREASCYKSEALMAHLSSVNDDMFRKRENDSARQREIARQECFFVIAVGRN